MEVAKAVDGAVAEAVGGESKVAVAFSGGLDSSIVARCAGTHARVVACTAFVRGAGDGARSRTGAEALGLELVTTELTQEFAEGALQGLSLPFSLSLMDRSLWCLYTAVAKSARESGARVLLLGQLADELFGGYAKYVEGLREKGEEAARRMMDADFREYASRGKVRDTGACSHWVEPRLPFEARELVELASSIPTSYMIHDGVRKAVLRRAAVMLGVPEEQATAAKKAAQYSSGVQKLVAALPF